MYKHKLIISVLFIFIPLILNSQDKPPVIEVTGNAEIKIEPDKLEMTINVNVEDEDLTAAKNKNDQSTAQVLSALKKLNIDDNDIITSGVNMSKNRDSYRNNRIFYMVTNTIIFKTPNITLYENVTTALIKIEDVYINNTRLLSNREIETRVKAREDALVAAKEKAEYMSAIFNMSIGKPVLITENTNVYYPNPFNAVTQNVNDAYLDRTHDLFRAGLISVTASVKVVFALVDR
jgi:uncharacterized protein YggE